MPTFVFSCEVIKDGKTGESLQYAFIEFEEVRSQGTSVGKRFLKPWWICEKRNIPEIGTI